MGFLDGLVGNVIGSMLSGNQAQSPLGAGGNQAQGGNFLPSNCAIDAAAKWWFGGSARQVPSGGLAQHADSWVSTGPNMNISADQLQQVFGSSTISDLASRLGIPTDQAGSAMAQMLPEIINRLTPQGQVPKNSNEEISQGLSALANSELLNSGCSFGAG